MVPSGVWIVAREPVHCARVSVRPRLGARPSLRIGGRDRTSSSTTLDRQVTAVRGILFDHLDAPVQAALCLPGAEFPLLRTLSVGDHASSAPPSSSITSSAAARSSAPAPAKSPPCSTPA